MSELKTKPNDKDVKTFLSSIDNDVRKRDAFQLLDIFTRVVGCKGTMWGSSIIGFGQYEYTNKKGNQSWMLTGFSPRKQNLTLYVMQGFEEYMDEIALLGKVKTAKSCLYISQLKHINIALLESLLIKSVADMKFKYPKHSPMN